jgi:hypothetical protein
MLAIIPNRETAHHIAAHIGKKGKVTCLTCKLKGCVGRCRFQVENCPRAPKAT